MSIVNNDKLFYDKVIPIMDKVRVDLQSKMADELEKHTTSFPGLLVGAAGPEGGAAGGQVVVTGTPEHVADCASSYTGHFLKSKLSI